MRNLVRFLLVSAAVAVAGGAALAQRQPGGGGQPGGGFGAFGGMGGGGSLKTLLASNKALQDDLKLSEDQVTKIKAFQEKQASAATGGGAGGRGAGGGAGGRGAGGGGGAGGRGAGGGGAGGGGGIAAFGGLGGFGGGTQSDEERLESLKTQVKNLEERIAFYKSTLSDAQTKRLSQIELQQQMQTAGPNIFSSEKMVKALGITDDQKEKIKSVNTDYQKEVGDLGQEYGFGGRGGAGGGGGGGFDREKFAEFQKKSTALRGEATEKVEKALTADQRKTWQGMVGEKFDLAKLIPQRDN